MRWIFTLIIATITVGPVFSQEKEKASYFQLRVGAKSQFLLSDFNLQLQKGLIRRANPIGFKLAGGFTYSPGRLVLGIDIATNIHSNSAPQPETGVGLAEINAEGRVGYNILKERRLEPSLGIGWGLAQLSIIGNDTTTSFNQVLGGAQNFYYDQSQSFVYLSYNLHFAEPIGEKKRVYLCADIGANTVLNNIKWNLPDLKIHKLNGFSFTAGVEFRF